MSFGGIPRTGPAGLTLKAWAQIVPGTGALLKSSNIATFVRNSLGNYTLTFTTALGTATYVVLARGDSSGTAGVASYSATGRTVAGCNVVTMQSGAGAINPSDWGALHVEFWE
jgi:hypothetical protein